MLRFRNDEDIIQKLYSASDEDIIQKLLISVMFNYPIFKLRLRVPCLVLYSMLDDDRAVVNFHADQTGTINWQHYCSNLKFDGRSSALGGATFMVVEPYVNVRE